MEKSLQPAAAVSTTSAGGCASRSDWRRGHTSGAVSQLSGGRLEPRAKPRRKPGKRDAITRSDSTYTAGQSPQTKTRSEGDVCAPMYADTASCRGTGGLKSYVSGSALKSNAHHAMAGITIPATAAAATNRRG